MGKDGQASADRRNALLTLLQNSSLPIKAAELAKSTGVSRQVIVQDIALLRARREPIMATPQGYIYLNPAQQVGVRKTIISKHSFTDTENELNILVDHGVTVVDVGIEHSVYGRIFQNLNLKTRVDVKRFIQHMADTEASLLSSLTNGVHSHNIEATSQENLDQACAALSKYGYLVINNES